MVTAYISLIVIGLLSALAFWRPNPVLFAILAGASIILGLNIPDLMTEAGTTTQMDLTMGLSLIAYALLCLAFAYKSLFINEEYGDDDE